MHSKKLFLSSAVLFISVTLLLAGSVGASSEMWSKTYGGPFNESAEAVVQTSDGGYALAGGNLLVKTDSHGNMLWNRSYPVSAYALVQASDGGYALAGGASLVKTDEYGNMLWNQTCPVSAYALIETSDGGYALAGGASLVKTDAYGNVEWNKTYSGWSAYALIETSDEGFAFAGYTRSSGADDTHHWDFWLVKTDSNGVMEWNQTYARTDVDKAYSLIETSDGGYALAGFTQSYGAGNTDFLLIKTDEYGIPEFPSWMILPLLVAATLTAVLYKKRLHKSSHSY